MAIFSHFFLLGILAVFLKAVSVDGDKCWVGSQKGGGQVPKESYPYPPMKKQANCSSGGKICGREYFEHGDEKDEKSQLD